MSTTTLAEREAGTVRQDRPRRNRTIKRALVGAVCGVGVLCAVALTADDGGSSGGSPSGPGTPGGFRPMVTQPAPSPSPATDGLPYTTPAD